MTVRCVFHGAMLPWIAPREAHLAAGRAWAGALGNVAGIVLLVFVLVFFYLPAHPLFGLDRAVYEHERIVGPAMRALWFWFGFSLGRSFIWTPDRRLSTGLAADL